ncbi:hypothetical protein E1A91_A09G073100v1, partial [Gossypium mustelinum]
EQHVVHVSFPVAELGIPSSKSNTGPEFNLSYLTSGWSLQSLRWVVFSIVDDVLWTVVTAFESLALVTTLCFFFLFCGCTF